MWFRICDVGASERFSEHQVIREARLSHGIRLTRTHFDVYLFQLLLIHLIYNRSRWKLMCAGFKADSLLASPEVEHGTRETKPWTTLSFNRAFGVLECIPGTLHHCS